MAYFEKNALDHHDLFWNLRYGKTVTILKGELILSTLDNIRMILDREFQLSP